MGGECRGQRSTAVLSSKISALTLSLNLELSDSARLPGLAISQKSSCLCFPALG